MTTKSIIKKYNDKLKEALSKLSKIERKGHTEFDEYKHLSAKVLVYIEIISDLNKLDAIFSGKQSKQ